MKLPFTTEQFLNLFREYNNDIYPLQLLFLLLAVSAVLIAIKGNIKLQKIPLFILSFYWFWMGAVYHIGYFSYINQVAYVFGALFILEGILLMIYGLTKAPRFVFKKDMEGFICGVLLSYALLLYPIIGYVNGHGYPYAPTFGLPCPTTIFTLAIILLSRPRLPFYLTIIPLVWCVVGFSAAFSLGIYEDAGLIISALVFIILYFFGTKPLYARNFYH